MACRGVHDRVLRRGLCVPVAVCVVLRLRCLKVESRLMDCHQGLTVASPLDKCAAERTSVLVGVCAVSARALVMATGAARPRSDALCQLMVLTDPTHLDAAAQTEYAYTALPAHCLALAARQH